jgi:hypothetical protein
MPKREVGEAEIEGEPENDADTHLRRRRGIEKIREMNMA